MRLRRLAPVGGLVLLAATSAGCSRWLNQLKARDQLNKGVGAFRNAQFQTAVNHFQTAVDLDPAFLNARLYLASAYQQLYIPEGESEENIKVAHQAIDAFEEVLKMDPSNTTAIASIALIYYQRHQFDKAKEYQKRRLQIEPNNSEPYYWIGLLNWTECFRTNGGLRKELNLNVPDAKGEFPPLPEKARTQLEQENGALVDEGLKALQKALDLKPNDSDAMAYMNLMLRQKADLESDKDARQADLQQAENWVEKAIGIKKALTEKAASK